MIAADKLYHIMDYEGKYYRTNGRNELVAVSRMEDAMEFTFVDANLRVNDKSKNKKKCYFMTPVPEQDTEMEVCQGSKELKVALGSDVEAPDWKRYLTEFTEVVEGLEDYRASLIKAESEVDLEICDILHYIELCDTSDEDAIGLVERLKECRLHRRNVKDEVIRLDAFHRTVGTDANVTRAKEAIKAIKGLETRRYTPRRLSELFEGKSVGMPTSGAKPVGNGVSNRSIPEDFLPEEFTTDKREDVQMEYTRENTVFDGRENDWMAFALQQAEFYRNVNQYIINLQLDVDGLDDEIADLMEVIDHSNCNVTQGFKLFKQLKELRFKRRQKVMELECLYILTERFDVNVMAYESEDNVREMERYLYGDVEPEMPKEVEQPEAAVQEIVQMVG